MDLSAEELKIKTGAETFANAHKSEIAKEVTNVDVFLSDENPVSVFTEHFLKLIWGGRIL